MKHLETKEVTIYQNGQIVPIFLVRESSEIFAYANSCPHTGAPLNWIPDIFLDMSKKTIQCANHDAHFRIQDGKCISGPCVNQGLKSIEISIVDNDIIFEE